MAGEALHEAVASGEPLGFVAPLVARNQAWVRAALGDVTHSRALLIDAIDGARERNQVVNLVLCAVDLARFGHAAEAAITVERIREYANPLVRVGLQIISALEALHPDRLFDAARASARMGWRLFADELVAARAAVFLKRREHHRAARCELQLHEDTQRSPLLSSDRAWILTPREREIGRRALHNVSSPQISAEMGLSVRTVDNVLGRVYRKCEVPGREALARALTRS